MLKASFLVDLKKASFLKDFLPLNSQRQRWMNLLFFPEVYCTSTSVPGKLYRIECTGNSLRGAVSSILIRCKFSPPSPFPLLAGKSAICGVNNAPKLSQEIRVFSPCQAVTRSQDGIVSRFKTHPWSSSLYHTWINIGGKPFFVKGPICLLCRLSCPSRFLRTLTYNWGGGGEGDS